MEVERKFTIKAGAENTFRRICWNGQKIVIDDRRITIRELAPRVPEISNTTIDNIFDRKNGYHKLCGRWVPRILTKDHKQKRVECVEQFFPQCEDNQEELLDSIVTGDTTWVLNVTPETRITRMAPLNFAKPKKFKQTLTKSWQPVCWLTVCLLGQQLRYCDTQKTQTDRKTGQI